MAIWLPRQRNMEWLWQSYFFLACCTLWYCGMKHNNYLFFFFQVWCQVRQCVSAIVVTSIRTHSLSHSSHLLDTYTSIVKALLHRRVEHIKQHPSLEPPSNFDDLSLFSGCLMKQACKDTQSRRYAKKIVLLSSSLISLSHSLSLPLSLSLSLSPSLLPSSSSQTICYSSWCIS